MRRYIKGQRRYRFDGIWEIYGLVDPRTKKVMYVGRTTRGPSRMTNALSVAKRKSYEHQSKLGDWLRELLKRNLRPEFKVFTTRNSLKAADVAEKRYINLMGRLNVTGKQK